MIGFTIASSPTPPTSEDKGDDGSDSDDADEDDGDGLPSDDEISTWCIYPFAARDKKEK